MSEPEKAEARPFGEIRETGFLWLINKALFHPRGYALAFVKDPDGNTTGWTVLGDGLEPWCFTEEIDHEYFNKAERTLAEYAKKNGPRGR